MNASSEGRYFSDFHLNKQCNEHDYRDKLGNFSNLAKIHDWRLEYFFFGILSPWKLSVAMETTILIQFAPKPNAVNFQSNDDSH